jgi:hypothetical protein
MVEKRYIIASKYYIVLNTTKKTITVYKKDKYSEKESGIDKYYLGSIILENAKYISVSVSQTTPSAYPRVNKASVMEIHLGKDKVIQLSK